ncbi:phosphotransferase [Kribbella deserti]|uniref:Phosphotransferase n=1 Tax=Kribbella deserti TaxID=1926257 RepID=A0ABV6QFI3_9ACTN
MTLAQTARKIGETVLGRDPGLLTVTESLSSQVFVGAHVVVKLADHARLDREIALAANLPAGLTPPLLGSGTELYDGREFRYACYQRAPGVAPGAGLPGVDAETARLLTAQALRRLDLLHGWTPAKEADQVLRQPLDHGGFTGRTDLVDLVERLASVDRDDVVRRPLLDGLRRIAAGAPIGTSTDVPVHADCFWDNWLVDGGEITALLDFEWARYGEPVDDYFFLIALSGEHDLTVLDVVALETGIPSDDLRAACEARSASYLASDVLLALTRSDVRPGLLADRLAALDDVVAGHWWQPS